MASTAPRALELAHGPAHAADRPEHPQPAAVPCMPTPPPTKNEKRGNGRPAGCVTAKPGGVELRAPTNQQYTASIQPAERTSCQQPALMLRINLLRHTSPPDAQASTQPPSGQSRHLWQIHCRYPDPSYSSTALQIHELQKGADTTPKTRLPVARAALQHHTRIAATFPRPPRTWACPSPPRSSATPGTSPSCGPAAGAGCRPAQAPVQEAPCWPRQAAPHTPRPSRTGLGSTCRRGGGQQSTGC